MANIQQIGDAYKLTVSLGYDINGKQIRKTTTFHVPKGTAPTKAKKLAEKAFFEFEQKCKGITTLNENMRFSELFDWYISNYANTELKEVTVFNYDKTAKKHVIPVFGNYKLKDITTPKITEFYKTLVQLTSERPALKTITVKKIHTILSSVFHCAVKQGFVENNPCKNAIRPRIEYHEKLFLNEEQAKHLMEVTEDYSVFNIIVRTLLYTGMRKGECLALRWEDIDFKNNLINVCNTLSYANGKRFLSEPKTKKSRRSIKISDNVVDMLLHHKYEEEKRVMKLGTQFLHPEMVFTTELGNYLDASYFNKKFKEFVSDNGLPPITTHDLRHCNATLLINAGIPLKIVSEHLGHCGVEVTANVYSHVLDKSKEKVMQALDIALG